MNLLSNSIGRFFRKEDDPFTRRMRFHQGWWRAFVLNLAAGPSGWCNDASGTASSLNFLTTAAGEAVDLTLERRAKDPKAVGLIGEKRLRDNLLSSQPLVFNFFGPLSMNLGLANKILPKLFEIGDVEIEAIHFEYAPDSRLIDDNTAYDAAVVFRRSDLRRGLIGIECKYTETFSPTEYDKEKYVALHKSSGAFVPDTYNHLKTPRFNQLFRTHLLTQAILNRKDLGFDEVHTYLFHSHEDDKCVEICREFKESVVGLPNSRLGVINFAKFLETAQQAELEWADREWTMRLWARYCKTLSQIAFEEALAERQAGRLAPSLQ